MAKLVLARRMFWSWAENYNHPSLFSSMTKGSLTKMTTYTWWSRDWLSAADTTWSCQHTIIIITIWLRSGLWFNIKMSSYQYRKSHCGDKTVVRSSYLHNGISYTGKRTSLYWIRAQLVMHDKSWGLHDNFQCTGIINLPLSIYLFIIWLLQHYVYVWPNLELHTI